MLSRRPGFSTRSGRTGCFANGKCELQSAPSVPEVVADTSLQVHTGSTGLTKSPRSRLAIGMNCDGPSRNLNFAAVPAETLTH